VNRIQIQDTVGGQRTVYTNRQTDKTSSSCKIHAQERVLLLRVALLLSRLKGCFSAFTCVVCCCQSVLGLSWVLLQRQILAVHTDSTVHREKRSAYKLRQERRPRRYTIPYVRTLNSTYREQSRATSFTVRHHDYLTSFYSPHSTILILSSFYTFYTHSTVHHP
jgi:hypothetical protein